MEKIKIKEIIQSYAISLNPTELQKEIAEERLSICMGNEEKKIPKCEHWVSDTLIWEHCSICKCGTGKAFSPVIPPPCPKKKWLR